MVLYTQRDIAGVKPYSCTTGGPAVACAGWTDARAACTLYLKRDLSSENKRYFFSDPRVLRLDRKSREGCLPDLFTIAR